jgi:hypothetical protein
MDNFLKEMQLISQGTLFAAHRQNKEANRCKLPVLMEEALA